MPDNEEIEGVKFSEFPSQTPVNADEVVGLHSGDNARFSIANIVAAVRQGLASIFVPKSDVGAANGVASLDSTGKVPSGQLPSSTGPEPATATPLMDGPGAVGSSPKYAREDHEHPADTNKQATITANGILKGDGQGGVTAATAGTDYQAPLTAGTDYATPAQLEGKANQTQLAYVETGTTASRNYTAGQYIALNGLLYTADTAIASGATFYTSGGNKNLTECVGGGLNNAGVYGANEVLSISGVFVGFSNVSGQFITMSIITPKHIPTTASITYSLSIGWVRGEGVDITDKAINSVTRTASNTLTIDIGARGLSGKRAYAANLVGSIKFG